MYYTIKVNSWDDFLMKAKSFNKLGAFKEANLKLIIDCVSSDEVDLILDQVHTVYPFLFSEVIVGFTEVPSMMKHYGIEDANDYVGFIQSVYLKTAIKQYKSKGKSEIYLSLD